MGLALGLGLGRRLGLGLGLALGLGLGLGLGAAGGIPYSALGLGLGLALGLGAAGGIPYSARSSTVGLRVIGQFGCRSTARTALAKGVSSPFFGSLKRVSSFVFAPLGAGAEPSSFPSSSSRSGT